MQAYEINPHAPAPDCASTQAFLVRRGDDRIRTGERVVSNDCAVINPDKPLRGSGLAPVYGVAMFAAVVVALIGERL